MSAESFWLSYRHALSGRVGSKCQTRKMLSTISPLLKQKSFLCHRATGQTYVVPGHRTESGYFWFPPMEAHKFSGRADKSAEQVVSVLAAFAATRQDSSEQFSARFACDPGAVSAHLDACFVASVSGGPESRASRNQTRGSEGPTVDTQPF